MRRCAFGNLLRRRDLGVDYANDTTLLQLVDDVRRTVESCFITQGARGESNHMRDSVRLVLGGVRVGAQLLGTSNNVDETTVVLDALLGAAALLLLRVFLLGHLGGLVLHLTGTRQRTVDLTTTAQTQDQVQRRFLLDVVVAQRASIFQLLASKDQALLIRRNAFLVLDLLLDVVDRVRRLDVQRDRLPSQRLDENLHISTFASLQK
ncbi:hypothetical protein Ae201684_007072 [Aphanomyces euteiches]|uniref:Uncharacterized protein n=1 Tax=Aphanomyces euteiches TaxID=100861 RepID=A0A6G0X9J3_9STRA|nr:hypothetical protein Ae201684_007072 [Aphanomyces euteiches]